MPRVDYFLTGSDPDLLEYIATEKDFEAEHNHVKSYDNGMILKCPGRILLLEDDNRVTYAITYGFGGSGLICDINVWTAGISRVISDTNSVTTDIYDELFEMLQSVRVESNKLGERFWQKRLVRDFHIGRTLVQERDDFRVLIDEYDQLCECFKQDSPITVS